MTDDALRSITQSCGFNCGSRCHLRLHVIDDHVQWVETDQDPDTDELPQMRACLCGRAMGHWLNRPERLDVPLKRIGPRGTGQFTPISWEEALDEVAEQLKRIVTTYGNTAVFMPFGTGLEAADRVPFERLLNAYGGYLGFYSDYSCCQLQTAALSLFGDDGYTSGSSLDQLADADLVVLFGATPLETRRGGAAGGWQLTRLREQAQRRGQPFRVVSIDPRHTDTVRSANDIWIPIRPGTDAALVAAVIYELWNHHAIDEAFLRTACVGFFDDTLPAGTPPNASYEAYLTGRVDGVPKTPEWAASLVGCPPATIRRLAQLISEADRAFIAQGWGPQRSEQGEQTARAICLLAIASGHFGRAGTNSGVRPLLRPSSPARPASGENPVAAAIPAFLWPEAVRNGTAMTALAHGVKGADQLPSSVKMIISRGSNCLTNQHGDINALHHLLTDEALCEFIVVCDVVLNDSARYADIILPELALAERDNVVMAGNADTVGLIRLGSQWRSAAQRKDGWEIARLLAQRLGIDAAWDGEEAGARVLASQGVAAAHELGFSSVDVPKPGTERKAPLPPTGPAYEAFRANPVANPLPTASGKVEIYSSHIAELQRQGAFSPEEAVSPIPAYLPASEGPFSEPAERFPLQFITYHGHQGVHSNFTGLNIIESLVPRALLMNPCDGQGLGLENDQLVVVENDRGALVCPVRLTPRIMPGVVALPSGAWHDADMEGTRLDWGGCANTLTSLSPSPLGKGNTHNSCQVRVRALSSEEREEGRRRGRAL
ncbi:MAG: molybdopterin-dependent oxidoreductase [Adlercreutzia sp.]|nr:molybdopterin-dependent oxidoreductase [Adlercreutzia sp.]